MTYVPWYRGSKAGKVDAHYSDYARERKGDRPNPRYPPLPPVEAQRSPPRPYKPDPRTNRPLPTRPVPMGPGDYGNGVVIDNDTGKRIKPPQNPFAGPPVTRGGLPVTGRRGPRPRFPGLPWLDVIDAVEPLMFPDQEGFRAPILPPNYRWCSGPVDWPRGINWADNPAFVWYGSCLLSPESLPLFGQVAEPLWWEPDPAMGPYWMIKNDITPIYWWRNNRVPWPIDYRGVVGGTAERIGPPHPDGLNQPLPYRPVITMVPPPDPNRMRDWPQLAPEYDPRPPRIPEKQDTPGTSPEWAPTPDSPYEPDAAWQWDPYMGTGSAPDTGFGGEIANDNPPFIPIPPVTRAPPTSGERQRKMLSRSAKIGIALYRALDRASELAEVVDCVWEGLPKEVQRRWKQCKENRRGDNFGQYGPDQADCKMRAVYHNYEKLDVEAVVKCIIKNELQDRIIGGMQAGLPRNTGNAHAEAEKKLAKWLDEIFSEELGL